MTFVATFFAILFHALSYAILLRVIMSWLAVSPGNPFVNFIHQITDPILSPLRRLIPPIGGTIDISPIIAIPLLQIAAAYAGSLG
ncbi:MAG: YggT family protein [Chloroflexota bacterium]|nr:YggT family protein [Chloroflexota bacterium]